MIRLQELRKKNKLSVKTTAKKLGISPKSLYNYETEKSAIPSNVLINMAKLYGVSLDYILGLKDYYTVTVVDESNNVLAMVSQDEIVEHEGYHVFLS